MFVFTPRNKTLFEMAINWINFPEAKYLSLTVVAGDQSPCFYLNQ